MVRHGIFLAYQKDNTDAGWINRLPHKTRVRYLNTTRLLIPSVPFSVSYFRRPHSVSSSTIYFMLPKGVRPLFIDSVISLTCSFKNKASIAFLRKSASLAPLRYAHDTRTSVTRQGRVAPITDVSAQVTHKGYRTVL